MISNTCKGIFVAIDGPNGVGKSTLIKALKNKLESLGLSVYSTQEPSTFEIGKFTRDIAEKITGNSLACLVAADRYNHLKKEIIPKLATTDIVIIDRYILSSLILQRMDEVDTDFILCINKKVISPDIQFAIIADREIIQARLNERGELTRFERNQRTDEELHFLNDGIETLINLGINVKIIQNNNDLASAVKLMIGHLNDLK